MLRQRLSDALKTAMREKNKHVVSTLRLILAAVKDRDIAARSEDNDSGISETELLKLLQSMVKQRRESAAIYEKGDRAELAEKELAEIEIIHQFLPKQIDGKEMEAIVEKIVADTGAEKLKDMGRVMASLREQYLGQMDFGKASAIIKSKLS